VGTPCDVYGQNDKIRGIKNGDLIVKWHMGALNAGKFGPYKGNGNAESVKNFLSLIKM